MSDAKNTADSSVSNSGANNSDDAAPRANASDIGDVSSSSIDPKSIEGVFLLALKKADPGDRETFLNDVCGDDQERRRRVVALLRAYDDAGSFLETPAGGTRPQDEVSLSFLTPSDNSDSPGTIGPYEVLEVIGRGGMGVVLRAIDAKLNRVVAVKVLIPELAANPNSRRRFLREAQAAAAVSHPNVVTIHAVEEAASSDRAKSTPPYLVMECVVGQSLQQKLTSDGAIPLPEILRISRQIGEGLAAAHKQGLIHRDIKPANILLENGVQRVKITDFGLARAIDDITVTRTGEVSGTPQYMSPEQANGERVDHCSDLFSLGCVMYAMCTGHSPFRGDSLAHVLKRVTQDTARPIIEQNPEIPAWLAQIIDCLLQKDSAQRFQSAEGVVAILDQHLARLQQPHDSGSHSVINQQLVSSVESTAPLESATPERSTVAAPVPWPVEQEEVPSALRLISQMVFWGISSLLVIAFLAEYPNQPLFRAIADSGIICICIIPIVVLAYREQRGATGANRITRAGCIASRCFAAWITVPIILQASQTGLVNDWFTQPVIFTVIAGLLIVIATLYSLRRHEMSHSKNSSEDDAATSTLRSQEIHETRFPAQWIHWIAAIAAAVVIGASASSWFIPDGVINRSIIETQDRLLRFSLLTAVVFIVGALVYAIKFGDRRQLKPWLLQSSTLISSLVVGAFWMTMMRTDRFRDLAMDEFIGSGALLWIVYCCFAGWELLRRRPDLSKDGGRGDQLAQTHLSDDDRSAVVSCCESVNAGVGRWMIRIGMFVGLLPVSFSLFRHFGRYGTGPMEVALVAMGLMTGFIIAAIGFTLRYVIDKSPENHRPMDLWKTGLLVVVLPIIVGIPHLSQQRRRQVSVTDIPVRAMPVSRDLTKAEFSKLPHFTDAAAPVTTEVRRSELQGQLAALRLQQVGVAFIADQIDDFESDSEIETSDLRSRLMALLQAPPNFPPEGADREDLLVFARTANSSTKVDLDLKEKSLRKQLGYPPRDSGQRRPAERPTTTSSVVVTQPPGEGERSGKIQFNIQDDGMWVALRRVSAFDANEYVPGSEQQVAKFGYSTVNLRPGRYEIGIQDRHYGWKTFRHERITVTEGVIRNFDVTRDMASLPKLPVNDGMQIPAFNWYPLRDIEIVHPYQVTILNQLLEASASENPEVVESELISQMRLQAENGPSFPSYVDNINNMKSMNDVFKTLPECISTGNREKSFRLLPAQQAELRIAFADRGLAMTLRPDDENADIENRHLESTFNKQPGEYRLPPGKYTINVTDRSADWRHVREEGHVFNDLGSLVPVETPITLANRETRDIVLKRDFQTLANFDPLEVKLKENEHLQFHWRTGGPGMFGYGPMQVTIPQAKCIRRLIQATAAGKPEVTALELQQLNGMPIHELFPGKNKSVGARFIVRGKVVDTWRLVPLKEQLEKPAAPPSGQQK